MHKTHSFNAISTYRILSTALLSGVAALSVPGMAYAQCAPNMSANQCATHESVISDLSSLGSEGFLDAYAATHPDFANIVDPAPALGLSTLDQISGEIHASAKTALLEDSRFAREAAMARLRAALLSMGNGQSSAGSSDTADAGLWGQVYGAWGRWQGDGNAATLDRSGGGFFLGGDGLLTDAVRLGIFGGYGHSRLAIDDRSSSASIDTWTLGAYGGGNWDAFSLKGGLAHSWHNLSSSRSIDIQPAPDLAFVADPAAVYGARTFQVFGEAAYTIEYGQVRIEPYANLAHVHLSSDGFAETGGEAALSAAASSTSATFTTLGVRAEVPVDLGETQATISGGIGWRHAFGGTPASTHTLALSGAAFTVSGVPLAKDALVLDAGFDLNVTENASLGFAYGGQFGSGVADNSVKASFNVTF